MTQRLPTIVKRVVSGFNSISNSFSHSSPLRAGSHSSLPSSAPHPISNSPSSTPSRIPAADDPYHFDEHISATDIPSLSPTVTTEQSLASDQGAIPARSILQWNAGGLDSQFAVFQHTMYDRDIQIAMMQEVLPHYIPNRIPPQLRYYHVYADCHCTTAIYVNQSVRHTHIPLRLPHNLLPVHEMHATAILAYLPINSTPQPVVLLNLYRSPTGVATTLEYLQYVQQIRTWCSAQSINTTSLQWLIGGDLNAKHEAWGSSPKSTASYRHGQTLYKQLTSSPYLLLNNGQPTRWYTHSTSSGSELRHSHIDVTWATAHLARHLVWRVFEKDQSTDHFQIFIDLDEPISPPITEAETAHWHLPHDERDWAPFHQYLLRNVDSTLQQIDSELLSAQTSTAICTNITDRIVTLYQNAAKTVCKFQSSPRHWPKTISKKGQALSIRYHRYFQYCKQQRHLNQFQTRKLRWLRKQRNAELRSSAARYYTRAFNEHTIHTKEGWQIAAQIRNLTATEGKSVPTLLDPATGEIVASQPLDKANLLNDYYHRHQLDTPLRPSHCWDPADAIYPIPRPLPDTLPLQPPPDAEPEFIPTLPPIPSTSWKVLDTDQNVHTASDLGQHFTDLLQRHVRAKWRRIQRKHSRHSSHSLHEYYTDLLNRRITSVEVQRSLRSFSNNKAYGPDLIHIQFLKRSPYATLPLLTRLFNALLQHGCIPDILKRRWITPLIKPGKTGRIPKDLRPISLTSYIGKILEKLVQFRLVTYLAQLQLLDATQFAYLPGRSTTDCILFLLDRVQRNLNSDRNATSNAIFFDFSSAFDTVQHNVLLWKLKHEYFITGPILILLHDLLADRFTAVRIDGTLSRWLKDTLGVPQGGALSPLLYILYMDNLGVINCIAVLRLGLFADDLCVFTTSLPTSTQISALQEAIYLIQWYALHHGLQLNLHKTQHVQFHNHPRSPPNHTPLYFSSAIHNAFCGPQGEIQSTDVPLTFTSDPVKYLGIYLDATLTFTHHSKYIERRCNALYYSLQRNLRMLWNIKADIAWLLLDVCILSVFDYSALLWPMLSKTNRYRWIRIFNRVIRTAFHSPRSTPQPHMLHHLNTPDLSKRMALQNSKTFSRFIRAPRNTAMYRLLQDTWWPYIKKYSTHPLPNVLTLQDFRSARWPIAKSYRSSALPSTHHTVLWYILCTAVEWDNDDVHYISTKTKLKHIQPRASYYVDLTKPWQTVQFDDTPYHDWLCRHAPPDDELLVFTDGSVGQSGGGGFGYFLVPSFLYNKWNFSSPTASDYSSLPTSTWINAFSSHLKVLRQDAFLTPYLTQHSAPLSHRCTIEFCEAMALHSAVSQLTTALHSKPGLLAPFTTLRLISDSQTVLNYLRGIYHIRSPVMRDIINDIHWNVGTINELHSSLSVIFQWTRSHHETMGNEYADFLANNGCRSLSRPSIDLPETTNWKYLSLKAACNRAKIPFWKSLQFDLTQCISDSTYGTTYKYIPPYVHTDQLQWTATYRKTLSTLSRYTVRILIAIRTGHDQLNYYRHGRISKTIDPHCPCGKGIQTTRHFLTSCCLPAVTAKRRILFRNARELHSYWKQSLSPDQYQEFKKAPFVLDLTQPRTYTDPPRTYPLTLIKQMQVMLVRFYLCTIPYTDLAKRS